MDSDASMDDADAGADMDPVVRSLPVHLLRAQPSAHVYALDEAVPATDAELGSQRKVLKARVKPKQKRIELDVSMLLRTCAPATSSSGMVAVDRAEEGSRDIDVNLNFDARRATEYGQQHMTLGSSYAEDRHANYLAVKPSQHGLVMVPVDAVLNMHPSFTHLDLQHDTSAGVTGATGPATGAAGAAGLASGARVVAATGGDMMETDNEEYSGPVGEVGVKFKKRESERVIERRKNSYAYLNSMREAEPWTELEFLDAFSISARQVQSALLRLHLLEAGEASTDQDAVFVGKEVLELAPSQVAVRAIKERDRVVSNLSQIDLESSSSAEHEDDVYSSDPGTLFPALLRRVRVIDLHSLFMTLRKNATISSRSSQSSSPPSFTMPPARDVFQVLMQCAVLVRENCWVCKSENVERSLSSKLSKRQQAARDVVVSLFRDAHMVGLSDVQRVLGPYKVSHSWYERFLDELAVRVHGKWIFKYELFEREEEGPFDAEAEAWMRASARELKEAQTAQASLWAQRIQKAKQSLRDGARSGGNFALVSEPQRARLLEQWFESKFQQYKVLSDALLEDLVEREPPAAFSGSESLSDILPQVQSKLSEMSVKIRGVYILKRLNNPHLDKYRDILLELFVKHEKVRRAMAREAMEASELGEDVPDQIYVRIMKDFADSRGSAWSIKTPVSFRKVDPTELERDFK
ncbi:DNA-directed RNA polymerase III subunit RPC5 [Porphyridium purpureum]|uniref:DNA-directed RNA polymerase III subunit RPC5 n=1 Tax=Porphyridium purpureum TaxID=35688 RepID=A0A5J4ZAM4_PORPP|nr:DNA-directed RNA polymerase III subunit RPC5 [Porphyridium purpureum]|eukprot:POR1805..scf295_1